MHALVDDFARVNRQDADGTFQRAYRERERESLKDKGKEKSFAKIHDKRFRPSSFIMHGFHFPFLSLYLRLGPLFNNL